MIDFIKDDGVWYRIIKQPSSNPGPDLMDCWAECWEPIESEELIKRLEEGSKS
jgi:hypothetical protein